MGNRCPDCNKFVSLEQRAEWDEEPEIDLTGEVSASVRFVLDCAECGTEIKETTLDMTVTCDEAAKHINNFGADDHELSVTTEDPEPQDRYQNLDKGGKSIPFRYQKHFYSATATLTVECTCGETWEIELDSAEEQAGALEDIN